MKRIHHLGVYDRNFGDTALNMQVDNFFKDKCNYSYDSLDHPNSLSGDHINQKVGNGTLIVGGGGLLHEYRENLTARPTGCIWEINQEQLAKIESKIVLYSVGYNHFYTDKNPIKMRFLLNHVLKNGIVSIRNDGSMNRLSRIFPDIIDQFVEIPDVGVFSRTTEAPKDDYILIQIACDRLNKRYNNNLKAFLTLVGSLVNNLSHNIKIIPHTSQDVEIYNKVNIKSFFNNCEVLPLMAKTTELEKVLQIYKRSIFTISTRGHSQIISVGNCVPTFSMSTHMKINGFAKSCGLEAFNFDYKNSPKEECLPKFNEFVKNLDAIENTLKPLNEKFDKQIESFNRGLL